MTIQYSTKRGNNYCKRKNKENPAVCNCQTEKSGQIDHQRSELLKILPISYFENSGQNHGFSWSKIGLFKTQILAMWHKVSLNLSYHYNHYNTTCQNVLWSTRSTSTTFCTLWTNETSGTISSKRPYTTWPKSEFWKSRFLTMKTHSFDPKFHYTKSAEFSVILTVGGRFGRFFRSDSGKI